MRNKLLALTGILMLLPCMLYAQGVTIPAGTTLSLGSSTLTVSGGWNNEGTFNAESSTVIFNGSGDQTIRNVSGDTFNNLVINKPAGNVILEGNIEINGELTLSGGNVNIGERSLTLSPTAIIHESPGARITGSNGNLSVTKNLNNPDNEDIGGLGLHLSSNVNLGSTTVVRSDNTIIANGNTSLGRNYAISATNTTGMNTTLVISYDETDLNGFPESSLRIFRSTDNGATLMNRGGIIDTANNTVTLPGVDAFSLWVLGASEPPEISKLEEFPADFVFHDAPQRISASLLLADPDDTNIENATIRISGNYKRNEDILLFSDTEKISGSWDAVSGTLTLSGTATIPEYQQAIRSVSYDNESIFITPVPRKISITVNDGTIDSNSAMRYIEVEDPWIVLQHPNENDSWDAGSTQDITWDSDFVDRGRIELTMDGGTTWITVGENVDLSTGSYTITVPEGSSANCLVRITSMDDADIRAANKQFFAITGAAPVWIDGIAGFNQIGPDSYEIQFNVTTTENSEAPNVQFEAFMTIDGTTSPIEACYGARDNDGTIGIDMLATGSDTVTVGTMAIPATCDSICISATSIRIDGAYYHSDFQQDIDTSCSPPTELHVSRIANDTGNDISVEWTAPTGEDAVLGYRIYRSRSEEWAPAIDVGTLSTPEDILQAELSAPLLIGNVPTEASSFVDTYDTDPAVVYYYWVEARGILWPSEKVVTMLEPAPALTLVSPNGDEQWTAGESCQITWFSQSIETGMIELSLDNGATWTTISENTNMGPGSYSLTVPEGSSPDCLVRVSSIDNPDFSVVSEHTFSINGTCPVTITDLAVFSQLSSDVYEVRFIVDNSNAGPLQDVRIDAYALGGDTPSELTEWYGTEDNDEIAGIDTLPAGTMTATVAWLDIHGTTNTLTVGATGIHIGESYYRIDFQHTIPAVCSPPSDISATAGTDGNKRRVTVRWNLSPDDGTIAEYRIYRSSNEEWAPAVDIATLSTPEDIIQTEQTSPLCLGKVSNGVNTFLDDHDADPTIAHYYWVEAVAVLSQSDRVFTMLPPEDVFIESAPIAFSVSNPYPNPFNPETTIAFSIPETCDASIDIYDVSGKKITSLHQSAVKPGTHYFRWNACDYDGNPVACGVYLYRFRAGNYIGQGKMSYMK